MSLQPQHLGITGLYPDGTSGLLDPRYTTQLRQLLAMQQSPLQQSFTPQYREADSVGDGIGFGLMGLAGGLAIRNQNKQIQQRYESQQALMQQIQEQQRQEAAEKLAAQRAYAANYGEKAVQAINAGVPATAFNDPLVSEIKLNQTNEALRQLPVPNGVAPIDLGNISTPAGINTARILSGAPTTVQDNALANMGVQKERNVLANQPVQLQQESDARQLNNMGQAIANQTANIQLKWEEIAQANENALKALQLQSDKQEIPSRAEEIGFKREAMQSYRTLTSLGNRYRTDPTFAAQNPHLNPDSPTYQQRIENYLKIGGFSGDFTPKKETPARMKVTSIKGNDGSVKYYQVQDDNVGVIRVYDNKTQELVKTIPIR